MGGWEERGCIIASLWRARLSRVGAKDFSPLHIDLGSRCLPASQLPGFPAYLCVLVSGDEFPVDAVVCCRSGACCWLVAVAGP